MPDSDTSPAMRLAYRPGEAASLVGTSRNFLYGEMRSGRLPTAKVGRARMILHRDLVAWLEGHRETRLAG